MDVEVVLVFESWQAGLLDDLIKGLIKPCKSLDVYFVSFRISYWVPQYSSL